jgi:hypothetical protein
MANAIFAQAVNRQSVALALRDARAKCAASQRWLNAVNRAALNLEACKWSFDGEALQVESATNSGKFYTVTVEACPCKAGQKGEPCWHRAGCRLLVKAAEMTYTAATTNGYQDAPVLPFEDAKPSMAELQAAVDELFA